MERREALRPTSLGAHAPKRSPRVTGGGPWACRPADRKAGLKGPRKPLAPPAAPPAPVAGAAPRWEAGRRGIARAHSRRENDGARNTLSVMSGNDGGEARRLRAAAE